MVERALHTGNIAAAFGVLATTADLSIAGGLGTVLGAALSATTLLGGKPPLSGDARAIAKDLKTKIETTHLSEDQKIWLGQMVVQFPPSAEDFTATNMDGAALAERLIARIKADAGDRELASDSAADAFRKVMPAVFQLAIDRAIANNETQSAMLVELMKRSDASGGTDRLRDEGITEKAIVRLAQRIASDTEDVGQAWLELQNAMDIAVRVQKEGETLSNHGGFVDEVLAQVAALSREGEYVQASDAIEEAFEREAAESTARKVKLLNSGVEVAMLARDTEKAATLLIRKADIEAGGVAEIDELRALQDDIYVLGRDKGLNLESRLAIDLARQVHERAVGQFDKGATLDDLAIALQTLGERENTPKRLKQAIDAYEKELEVFTRADFPRNWATAQNNLGATLQTLAEREVDTAKLSDAVSAYQNALKERTQDKDPLEWAATQNNLGNALQTLSVREAGSAKLAEAVTAYENALKVRTQDKVPLEWAATQNNLGGALRALGEREADSTKLAKAVTAYENAQKEWTQGKVPFNWALTQYNLAVLFRAFFNLELDPEHLDSAEGHVETALKVFREAGADHFVGKAERIKADIQARRDAL